MSTTRAKSPYKLEVTSADGSQTGSALTAEITNGGVLDVGMPADLLILDLDGLDRDTLLPVPARDLFFARATAAHVIEVWASGRQVVREGHVLGIDLNAAEASLRAAYRAGLPTTEPLRAVWQQIERAIGEHYQGCC